MNFLRLMLLISLMSACGHDSEVSEKHTFQSGMWSKTDTVQFERKFDGSENVFEIGGSVLFETTYEFPNLRFGLTIVSPDEVERTYAIEVFPKDELRNFAGTKKGNQYELQYTAVKKFSFFQKGDYLFRFIHFMPLHAVGGISELTMTIRSLK